MAMVDGYGELIELVQQYCDDEIDSETFKQKACEMLRAAQARLAKKKNTNEPESTSRPGKSTDVGDGDKDE